jgi:hypothetical protein
VVRDVAGQAAALPLLSSALVGTWERRRGAALTLAGYLEAGVTALARTASRAGRPRRPGKALARRRWSASPPPASEAQPCAAGSRSPNSLHGPEGERAGGDQFVPAGC